MREAMAAAQPIASSQEGAENREVGSITTPAAGGNREVVASSVGAGTASRAVGSPHAFGSGGKTAASRDGGGMSTSAPCKGGSTPEGRCQDERAAGDTSGEASSGAAPSGGGLGSNSLGNGDDIDDEDLLII